MMSVLMALGPYRFEVARAAHDTLARQTAARWPVQERIGRPVALQFTGAGEDEIRIEGTLYPEITGGIGQIEALRADARAGAALMLVSGLGRVFGRFALRKVETQATYLDRHGTPRRLAFSLDLSAYGEDGAGGGGLRLFR